MASALGRMRSVAKFNSAIADLSSEATDDTETVSTSTRSTAVPPDVQQQQAQHSALIALVISKAAKIQKDTRARRYRALNNEVNDAIDALTDFKDETWPPRVEEVPKPPDWMDADKNRDAVFDGAMDLASPTSAPSQRQEGGEVDDEEVSVLESAAGTEDSGAAVTTEAEAEATAAFGESSLAEETPVKDLRKVLEGERDAGRARADERDGGTYGGAPPAEKRAAPSSRKQQSEDGDRYIVAPVDDDPQTREPMHPAVVTAMHVFCRVMTHPQKTPKMSETALDCVTLLITNRYVSGRAGGRNDPTQQPPPGGVKDQEPPPVSFLHGLILSITKCSESSSEVVQGSMSKALLALMTSPKCGVHEASMLMAVRATFHVYLVSKSVASKDVAKATLIDMLKSVFNRMEAYDAMVRDIPTTGEDGDGTPVVTSTPVVMSAEPQEGPVSNGGSKGSQAPSQAPGPKQQSFSAFASQFHTDGYLLFRALCKLSAKTLPGDDGTAGATGTAPQNKLLSFAAAPVDPLALHSKILSLEMILAVFEHCGEAFRTGDKFIYAVQNYLCVSLLKNCMSNHTQVAYLSLKIFLVLVVKFKAHLKSEIEVFVANIFLRVLESPNSSHEQKSLVLEALRALCADPLMLTQLFLNYDCDFDAVNLYKDIVHNLTKLSGKNRGPLLQSGKAGQNQDFELSLAGLEVLVVILRAFLKALGLPGGDDDLGDGASRIRGSLQLDVGLAGPVTPGGTPKSMAEGEGKAMDDAPIAAEDIRSPEALAERGDASSGGGGGGSDVANKIVDAFDRKRTAQQNFENGIVKFTLSLKGGLLYFIENGFVKLNAEQVAVFLLEHKDRLDKTQIGELLGKEPESAFVKDEGTDPELGGEGFFVRVLYHYVDAMDFSGMEFDAAIRSFLSGFRLPGEAQKIDRIMEKFAERYTRQNEEVFPSADTAFILAFSVIMLNTDLHNPSIKPEKRMTLESFIRNNRGISVDGGDLPEDFLAGIFSRIQAQPFTLKEDDDARAKADDGGKATTFDTSFLFDAPTFFGASAEERKRENFRKEREEMMNASEQLFKKRPGKGQAAAATSQLTESVSPADVVKPMFDVTWGPLIGTLSQVLEMTEDESSIALCLSGFVYAVRVSAHSGMSLARDTFVNSLAKFTTLGSIKEMKHKNIECIRTLLSIAIIDGEYLGESWGPVLQCISQLGRLQLFASGLDSDDKFLRTDNSNPQEVVPDGGFFKQPTKAETDRELEESNGRAVLAAVNEVLIDKVFSSTVKLSARGIVHFVEQLIAVSELEIAGNSKRGITGVSAGSKMTSDSSFHKNDSTSGHSEHGPRIFSLQRLVEVADYNMDVRPRISWAQMWEMMANHLAKLGCHENAMVSMFAIDALRQLSFKFLEKPELSDFNFQRLFLRPFFVIMENTSSREDTRELILRCVDNMIRILSHNLRSGWKIFFEILTLSASDPSEKISTLGLAILQRLLDEHLDQLCRLVDSEGQAGAESSLEVDGAEHETKQMDAFERRQRNANAEDFVGLCHASLSFVQTEITEHPLPIGLSMRALCHTACYADLIAIKRVLPPVSGCQTTDPFAFGYTYEGLTDGEAEEMVLWRPLLDGLGAGICSIAPSNSGGVGCLVQRGSLMTLRAVLLRHGKMFSTSQWRVILEQAILPALQIAAESDNSAVTTITSESPAVSSLDFLADALPLPPPPNDEGLTKFALMAQTEESAPTRPLGPAELLVEASFADLRHGGDGDLSRAHGLAKKNGERKNVHEQPFPDSWVATTAPIALGTLTDIAGEMVLNLGAEGREALWPIIMGQLQRWSIGYPLVPALHDSVGTAADGEPDGSECSDGEPWVPCEALVRIGCKELNRFPHYLLEALPRLSKEEAIAWPKTLWTNLAETLSKNVEVEAILHEELVRSKLMALGISDRGHTAVEMNGKNASAASTGDGAESHEYIEGDRVSTPYGEGTIVEQRMDDTLLDDNESPVVINVVKLDSGATLYGPPIKHETKVLLAVEQNVTEDKTPKSKYRKLLARENYLDQFIPSLKVRCVASHCLQQHLPSVLDALATHASKDDFATLLDSLELSRLMSRKASLDEDLAHAFQEAMFSEWGDGVEEVEAAMATEGGVNHRGGSEMFFLTQQAGANKAIIHLLGLLYIDDCSSTLTNNHGNVVDEEKWDSANFAEPLLLDRMMDVLDKFLASEAKDGNLIDPNVWRMSSESGGQIAFYCTSFASVVVSILKHIMRFSPHQFNCHKAELYPLLCALIRVQSDEIRQLVHEIFVQQIAPLLDLR